MSQAQTNWGGEITHKQSISPPRRKRCHSSYGRKLEELFGDCRGTNALQPLCQVLQLVQMTEHGIAGMASRADGQSEK